MFKAVLYTDSLTLIDRLTGLPGKHSGTVTGAKGVNNQLHQSN